MTERQVNMVRGYKAAKLDTSPDIQQFYDLRESDGSPLSDLSRMRHEFHRIMQFKSILRSFDWEEPPGQKELAFFLCDQIPSGEWWKLLCLEYIDGEEQPDGQYLHCASALYTKPGARDEMLRVLHDDDPCIAAAMSNLLGDMRLYTQRVVMLGEVEYAYGDLVDPEVIPAELVKVMERHPHLKVHMAGILSIYGSHAASHVNKIVPLLLSDDPLDVQLIRSYMTNIDPKLAGELEITSEIYGSLWEEYEQLNCPEALNARQRQLIEDYLKTIK